MLGLRSGDGKLNKPSATLILAFVYPPVRKWYEAGRRLGKHPNN
jgi:hypothetical protein